MIQIRTAHRASLVMLVFLCLCSCSHRKDNPNLSIYARGRTYEYKASYFSSDDQLLTESRVKLIATGNPWNEQPDLQSAVVCDYEFNADHKKRFSPHPLNPGLDRRWVNRVTTGVIEKPNWIWTHPIRENQFISTEVAPFPQVPLPLKVGQTYAANVPIPKTQWGKWGGNNIRSTYEVVARQKKEYPFCDGEIECWEVRAESTFQLGTSTLTVYFNEKYGFVEMHYKNYANERITFLLEEVTVPEVEGLLGETG